MTDPEDKFLSINWIICFGRRKSCRIFKTETYKKDNVVYSYISNMYLKDIEIDLKLTDYQQFLTKKAYLLR